MIAVIETTMSDLSHEAFNAGMLYQLHRAYPNEKIIYFCEKEQGKCVKRILDAQECSENIEFSFIGHIYLEYNRQEIQGNKEEYVSIFQKCKNARFVMILSLEAVNSGLLKNLIRKFPNIKFGICIHGYIEEILPQNAVEFELKHGIVRSISIYRRKKKALAYFKNNLRAMAELPNCNIILYSDIYRKYKNCIEPSVYQNIKVLNLPYAFTYNKKSPETGKKFLIGIMPSSAAAKDQNCAKIIKYMIEQKERIRRPYHFVILNYDIGVYENVDYIRRPGRTRKDVEQFMEICDWMMIPYDENKYILSSSGVMFDAIEAERPFFTLGSPSFIRAIEAGCGIQEEAIEKLGEQIIRQINEENPGYERYRENIRKYKERMEKENTERLVEIFGK